MCTPSGPAGVVGRVAGAGDAGAIAALRAVWNPGPGPDPSCSPPSAPALAFYRRAGFVVPDDAAGADRLLVRPGRRR